MALIDPCGRRQRLSVLCMVKLSPDVNSLFCHGILCLCSLASLLDLKKGSKGE